MSLIKEIEGQVVSISEFTENDAETRIIQISQPGHLMNRIGLLVDTEIARDTKVDDSIIITFRRKDRLGEIPTA